MCYYATSVYKTRGRTSVQGFCFYIYIDIDIDWLYRYTKSVRILYRKYLSFSLCFLSIFSLSLIFSWYQSRWSQVRTLTPFYLPFKKLKIPRVGPHSLRRSLSPHVKGSVRILVKWLNSPYPNSLSFWDNR